MAWEDIGIDVLSAFADASHTRGHVRSLESQRYLNSLPWSVREGTAGAMRDEFGPGDPAMLAGPAWPDVEEYFWRLSERRRVYGRDYARDRYSRRPERLERARRTRELRDIKRGQIVGVRCCPVCRKMYAVTALMEHDDNAGACSRTHRWLASSSKGGSRPLIARGAVRDTLAGWAKRHGLSPALVRFRIKQRGWNVDRALTTPAAPSTSPVDTSIAGRARAAGLNEKTVRKRIASGMSVEDALATRVKPRPETSIAGRAREAGVNPGLVRKRIAYGWTIDDALGLPKRAPEECRGSAKLRSSAQTAEAQR